MLLASFSNQEPPKMSADPLTKATGDQHHRHRARVIRTGQIVFNGKNCSMGCTVMDLSRHGARLRPDDPFQCPDEFSLVVKEMEERSCHVVWRAGLYVGVNFVKQGAVGNPLAED
jgi:hypothetical protein